MSENKCCGNCAHSYGKDMDGYCACGIDGHFTGCDEVCDKHIMRINGWIEITPDNVESLKQVEEKRIVIANKHNSPTFYRCLHDINGLDSMVKQGGYYYFILPELKIV